MQHIRIQDKTLSCSHCMQRAPSLSSKNPIPNWLANRGTYSIIASRTLQWRSSASSTIAGNKDCDSKSIPITCRKRYFGHQSNKQAIKVAKRNTRDVQQTWLTWSSLLMMLRRTSGNSSFRRERKIGSRCSIVESCIEDFSMLIIIDEACNTIWGLV